MTQRYDGVLPFHGGPLDTRYPVPSERGKRYRVYEVGRIAVSANGPVQAEELIDVLSVSGHKCGSMFNVVCLYPLELETIITILSRKRDQ